VKSARAVRLWSKFRITQEQYEELLRAQGGGCAVCGKTEQQNGQALAVDHSHKTNKVRGLLCKACNYKLGLVHDTGEWLAAAGAYLAGAVRKYLDRVIARILGADHVTPPKHDSGWREIE